MTSESNSESMPELHTPEPKNFFSRLAGVYFSPRETFEEIGRSPRVLVPIIVLIVISALVGFYLSKNLDLGSIVAGQLEKAVADGRITQEQMDNQVALVSKFAGIQLIAGAALGSLAMTLLIAGGFKLVSGLIGAENRFKAIFAVSTYTMIAISVVQSALLILVLHIKGPQEIDVTNVNSLVASNLGAMLSSVLEEGTLPKFFMRLAGWIDIFAIWAIALLAIGYSAVSRKLKTAKAATWLAVAYGIIAIIGAAIGSLFR